MCMHVYGTADSCVTEHIKNIKLSFGCLFRALCLYCGNNLII